MLLYRRRLDARSGAGQLILMQAEGLEHAGFDVRVACARGGLKFRLRTGRWVRRVAVSDYRLDAPADIVVDHGLEIAAPSIQFVHGSATVARSYVERDDWAAEIEREARFFDELAREVPVVANSGLLRAALIAQFGLAPEQVAVIHPGYRRARFDPAAAGRLRDRARRRLGIDARAPVFGMVTSGDFLTRGLDIFLDAARLVAAREPGARFLVVGSRRLPDWAARHPVAAAGKLAYRPKSAHPELWMSALDVFVHAGRFDAFGMVLLEALALGVPVVATRQVGATECLPDEYAPWVADSPESSALAERALELFGRADERGRLRAAGMAVAQSLTDERYAAASARAIGEAAARQDRGQ